MSLIKAKQLISPRILRANCLTNIIERRATPTVLRCQLNEPPKRYFNWRNVLGLIQNPVVLAKKDGIPVNSDYETVYNARNMCFYVICANYYVVVTAFASLAYFYSEFGDITPLVQDKSEPNDQFFKFHGTIENGFATAGLLLLNCGVLYVIHRFPLRIYHSEANKNFIVVFNKIFLPWKTTSLKCNPGSVKNVGESTFHSILGRYKLGRKRIYLMSQYFRYPVWYNILLGYSS